MNLERKSTATSRFPSLSTERRHVRMFRSALVELAGRGRNGDVGDGNGWNDVASSGKSGCNSPSWRVISFEKDPRASSSLQKIELGLCNTEFSNMDMGMDRRFKFKTRQEETRFRNQQEVC